MKALVLASLLTLIVTTSSAINESNPTAVITVDLSTGRKDGSARYDLFQESNRQIRITIDPNHCGDSGQCTKLPVHSEVVTPRIIGNVKADGTMTISLTGGLQMIVINQLNGNQSVYLRIPLAPDGGPVMELPLRPLLTVGIEK